MNRIQHDLSPFAGFRDPIADRQRVRIVTEAWSQFERTLNGPTANLGSSMRTVFSRTGRGGEEPDPRVDVAEECGWPTYVDPQTFTWLYLTDSLSARVVEFMAKQAWMVWPELTEGGEIEGTPLTDSWWELNETLRGTSIPNGYFPERGHAIFSELKRADILAGIGSYGGVYLALEDGLDPRQPAGGVTEDGSRPAESKDAKEKPLFSTNGTGNAKTPYKLTRNAAKVAGRRLLSVQALPETLCRVVAWETNERSPRNGWPILYEITLLDPDASWSGSVPSLRTVYAHWTRVVHIVDQTAHTGIGHKSLSNSRMKCVLPELLDSRKISGAGGIAFWRNAVMKLFLSTHPQLGGDVLYNKQAVQDEFELMMNGLQQWMILKGMSVNPVAPLVADPTPHQNAKIERVCIKNGWPVRVFKGSERGELSSTQDEVYHKDNVRQHQNDHENESVIAPAVNQLVFVGALEKWGKDGYTLPWPEVGTMDPLKKAQVFATRMSAFAAASQQQLMDPEDVLIREAGFTEEEAEEINEKNEERIAEEEEQAALFAKQGLGPDGQPLPPQFGGGKEEEETPEQMIQNAMARRGI